MPPKRQRRQKRVTHKKGLQEQIEDPEANGVRVRKPGLEQPASVTHAPPAASVCRPNQGRRSVNVVKRRMRCAYRHMHNDKANAFLRRMCRRNTHRHTRSTATAAYAATLALLRIHAKISFCPCTHMLQQGHQFNTPAHLLSTHARTLLSGLACVGYSRVEPKFVSCSAR